MPNLAAVIVNYNDSERISKLVKKLESYNILSYIIISDNNSSEKEKKIINNIQNGVIKVLYNNENLGFSGANNRALNYLKEFNIDYVFTINSDVIVSKETMQSSVDFLEKHKEISLVSAEMIENENKKQCFYNFPTIKHAIAENLGLIKIFHIKPKKVKEYNEYYTCDYIRSSYWCVNYNDFTNINFFDTNTFLYHVETCVGIKLHRKGKKCAILKNYTYQHNHIYKDGYKIRGYKDSYKSLLYIFKEYYNKTKFELELYKASYWIGLILRKILRIK